MFIAPVQKLFWVTIAVLFAACVLFTVLIELEVGVFALEPQAAPSNERYWIEEVMLSIAQEETPCSIETK